MQYYDPFECEWLELKEFSQDELKLYISGRPLYIKHGDEIEDEVAVS